MLTSLDRRTTLRLGLAALGSSLLAGCASDGGDGGAGPRPPRSGSMGEVDLASSTARRAAGDPALVPEVVAGLDALAGGLYDALARRERGNLVLSPLSVLVALGMTLAGAGGRTAAEMRAVLGSGDLGERWHQGVNALTRSLTGLAGERKPADGSTAELVLASADQLFGQKGVQWKAEFLDLLAKEYGAPVRGVDFAGHTERARTLINDWVEERTAERIVDLVPAGVLDAATRLVLVDAIYLKAPWETPFEKSLTARGSFHLADGRTVAADLMRQPALPGRLVTGRGWRAVALPYAGGELAMTVVLPDPGRLAEVERRISADGLAAFTATGRSGEPTSVDLTLPRWTFRTEAALREVLTDLGMPTAFGDAADFRAMTDDVRLSISEVVHQAFVAVDEEGTEAAAATAVVMTETSAPVAEPFVVDRPFVFVVHDVAHAAPLFVGRVSDPTA